MQKYERRHADRFEVPGATIQYRLPNGIIAKVPLKDMTPNSAGFEISHYLKAGDDLEIDIILPNNQVLNIKAKVARVSNYSEEFAAVAGVQFLPFSTDDHFNSIEAHDELKEIASKYHKTNN